MGEVALDPGQYQCPSPSRANLRLSPATLVRAIFHRLPILLPLLSPRKRTSANRTDLGGEVRIIPLRHASLLRPHNLTRFLLAGDQLATITPPVIRSIWSETLPEPSILSLLRLNAEISSRLVTGHLEIAKGVLLNTKIRDSKNLRRRRGRQRNEAQILRSVLVLAFQKPLAIL